LSTIFTDAVADETYDGRRTAPLVDGSAILNVKDAPMSGPL
jgi:hypothetical protein